MLVDTPAAFSASPESDRGSDLAWVTESLSRAGGGEFAIAGVFEGEQGGLGSGSERLVSVAVCSRDAASKRKHVARITSVYTLPAARGRGYARQTLAWSIARIRTWPGVRIVQLSVNERSTAARALYESLGFVMWGVEPEGNGVGGEFLTELHMWMRV